MPPLGDGESDTNEDIQDTGGEESQGSTSSAKGGNGSRTKGAGQTGANDGGSSGDEPDDDWIAQLSMSLASNAGGEGRGGNDGQQPKNEGKRRGKAPARQQQTDDDDEGDGGEEDGDGEGDGQRGNQRPAKLRDFPRADGIGDFRKEFPAAGEYLDGLSAAVQDRDRVIKQYEKKFAALTKRLEGLGDIDDIRKGVGEFRSEREGQTRNRVHKAIDGLAAKHKLEKLFGKNAGSAAANPAQKAARLNIYRSVNSAMQIAAQAGRPYENIEDAFSDVMAALLRGGAAKKTGEGNGGNGQQRQAARTGDISGTQGKGSGGGSKSAAKSKISSWLKK